MEIRGPVQAEHKGHKWVVVIEEALEKRKIENEMTGKY